ncbi:MAG: thiol:disulfide interchange protein DsbA/DsbL [Candidatus Nitricoxidivorans perseverans]|uniref:Thiol:disulfide interchange protein n=1 Tax=Candidatus Nitricoxidivorans perseverans TaxID=2975601 RepID=A0AA49FK40_9PROT|nr:MAG: thiol:disulfide interchange protein DsbA/DsbL [Candidatus Nitricoxidivorans perseverans]
MRKLTLWLASAALFSLSGLAGAAELKEGQHYTTFNPPRSTEARDKIEVTEFFWYGCAHCFNFDPILHKWLKKLPADIAFRRVPAIFPGKNGAPGNWAPGAKLYYALEAMGLLEKLHGEVFDAMHIDRINLQDEKVLREWLGRKGVDAQKFFDTWNSFAIQGKVQRAQQLTLQHGLTGVPAMVVDGKYMPASGGAGSHEEITAILDQLIEKARKDRKK